MKFLFDELAESGAGPLSRGHPALGYLSPLYPTSCVEELVRRIAFVTYSGLPDMTADDGLAAHDLGRHGVEVSAVDWAAGGVDWARFDLVVVRSCWDYHYRPDEFRAWIERMERDRLRLLNPPDVLRWNMDKSYLARLQERGLFVVPTVCLERGADVDLPAILRDRGWQRAVVKPTISATAHQTWITTLETAGADTRRMRAMLQKSGVLVQRFIDEVRTQGEWSLMFFGREYSHAALKLPASGDFRVQNEFGGSVVVTTPSAPVIEQARAILDLVGGPLLYARVDGIEVDGALMLMELELIEPSLFLGMDALAPRRFARAILDAMGAAERYRP